MALFLGLYGKRERLREEDYRHVLAEFGCEGSRNVTTRVGERTILATVRQGGEPEGEAIAENADGSRIALFGGEFYGFEYGTGCDPSGESAAEIMLRRFEESGDGFLGHVNGAFALAVYDLRRDELTLSNDSFGMHPLFVHDSPDVFAFCSEYEPITRLAGFDRALDLQAIGEYFSVKAPLADRTFFRAIRNLRPGTTVVVGPRGCREQRHDELVIAIDREIGLEAAAEEVASRLRRSVALRLRGRERARCALTGGLDTRAILACMRPEERQMVEFHTNRTSALPREDDRDVLIAEQIAEKFGLRHVVRDANAAHHRDVDRAFLRSARRLSGSLFRMEGFYGGEFLGGAVLGKHDRSPQNPDPERVQAMLREVFPPEIAREIENPVEMVRAEMNEHPAESGDLLVGIQYRTRAFFTHVFGGSAAGWVIPYRQVSHDLDSIFRDTGLLRFLLSLPREFLERRRLYDAVYRQHFREVCSIPSARESDVVPHLPRRTQAPSPRPRFRKILDEYVASELTWEKGLYAEHALRSALEDEGHWLVRPFADFESWLRERWLA